MTGDDKVTVTRLRAEHLDSPLGVGTAMPRLSWSLESDRPVRQVAYEIGVSSDGRQWGELGRRAGTDGVLVPWPGTPLRSRERCLVRVRVWADGDPTPSAWSEVLPVEASLLAPGDWQARLVAPAASPVMTPRPAYLLRKVLQLKDSAIVQARWYVTAHGLAESWVNGRLACPDLLTPGWTSYPLRLRVSTYDVTDLVHGGTNVVGAQLADGWYRGFVGFDGGVTDLYGSETGLLGQLEVTYEDGSTQVFGTDETWSWSTGPITATGLYEGERYEQAAERAGWCADPADDGSWSPVELLPLDLSRLEAPTGPPVRVVEELSPTQVTVTSAGTLLVDFGQNISGKVRLDGQAKAGRLVRVRHAEILEDGELCIRPLRQAAAVDEYLPSVDGAFTWQPTFTVHGFRYAEVSGLCSPASADAVTALVCHSDMSRAGWFECSDPLVNRLHENVVWSMRGNFVDLPTDCPQRDERLGWTGDIAAFAPTAAYLYHCTGLLTSWLRDLAAEQAALGTVPHYVPWVQLHFGLVPAAAWGDAAVLVPWALYERTGDLDVLRTQYDSMRAWVDQVAKIAGEHHLWDSGFQFGDWLDPSAPPDRPAAGRTDKYLVATAYHFRTTQLLAGAARLLGHDDDADAYEQLAGDIQRAFVHEFVTPAGRVASDSTTAYALALRFGLLDNPLHAERAGRRLVELVRESDFHIATGFVGTPLICDALTDAGYPDVAYQLLLQTECPSWLYPVTMGATTIWERWDSMLPDGSVNPGDMTSFNHYALGAVADWLHRVVGGLAPESPGYQRILVAPRPGGGLTHASAAHLAPYGRVEVSWRREGSTLEVEIDVPQGSTAVVRLPATDWRDVEVGPGRHSFACDYRDAADDPRTPEPVVFHDPAAQALGHEPREDVA